MDDLQAYLRKYLNLVPPEASKRKILSEVIYKECGIKLKEADITMSGNGVRVNCHPTVRSELARCTSKILSALHKDHGIHIAFIR